MDDDANESDDDNGHHDAIDMYCWPFRGCSHITSAKNRGSYTPPPPPPAADVICEQPLKGC